MKNGTLLGLVNLTGRSHYLAHLRPPRAAHRMHLLFALHQVLLSRRTPTMKPPTAIYRPTAIELVARPGAWVGFDVPHI